MTYQVRQRQLGPTDDAWLVVSADDWTEVEGVRSNRELAEALRERLDRWQAAKPLSDDSPLYTEPGDLGQVLSRIPQIEPSAERIAWLKAERGRLAVEKKKRRAA